MPSEFSLRQVLACLNISVFDPLVEPALKKLAGLMRNRKRLKEIRFTILFLWLSCRRRH